MHDEAGGQPNRSRACPRGCRRFALVSLVLLLLAVQSTAIRRPIGSIYDSLEGLEAATGAATSRNWAGYIVQQAQVTAVEGSWIVPAVPLTPDERVSGTWIGIGGATGPDLIQAGTVQQSRDGHLQYILFYEVLPNLPVSLPVAVRPADDVHVAIQQFGPDRWQILTENRTTGQQSLNLVTYHSSQSSAEWIEEAPEDLTGALKQLANFGSVDFRDLSLWVANQPVDLSAGVGITMRAGDQNEVTVTPTTPTGFTASYTAGS